MAGAKIADQQGLDLAAARSLPDQARGNDFRVVEHQQVTRLHEHRQVPHDAIVQAVGRDIEQARAVTRYCRTLGYELLGKLEVEEIDAHGAELSMKRWRGTSDAGGRRWTKQLTLRRPNLRHS